MLRLPELIEPLFRTAGWQPSEIFLSEVPVPPDAAGAARRIIDEFGGLCVGTCTVGTEQAASDIRFFTAMQPQTVQVAMPWRGTVGELWAFACAHHDHMALFVGANSQYYIFTDPDERLYEAGCDFRDLMRTLLWGYKFGAEVARDA